VPVIDCQWRKYARRFPPREATFAATSHRRVDETSQAIPPSYLAGSRGNLAPGANDHKRCALLQFVGVSKTFEAVVAIAPLDLSVASGDTLVLIGPSGSGKTTVLRMALGLLWPDAGQVRSMGYVVQEGGLFPHLTAGQNVSLMARHLLWPRTHIEQRQAELAALTRFPVDALGRYPFQLSGGQRRRVSLMRALMLDPDLLPFDGPLGSIDPLVRAELQQDLVRVFQQTAKAVVLVTHDLSEAAFFARDDGQVELMRQGRVLQQGRVERSSHSRKRALDETPGTMVAIGLVIRLLWTRFSEGKMVLQMAML
jgi:osmoprotectant transport system ATP-binding protein